MGILLPCLYNGILLAFPGYATTPTSDFKKANRTHVSTTEPLDPFYKPAFSVSSRYESYFQPTMLTDAGGNITDELMADCLPPSPWEGREIMSSIGQVTCP